MDIQGPKLKEHLPNDFNIDQPDQCLPPAPNRDFMNSDSFNNQLKSLFDTSHLQLIQSTYFGPRGPTQLTLQKSSLHKVLVDHIPPKNDQRQSLDVYIMKQVLAKYTVNFINLWDNPKQLNNLLNRLLRVLLKIYLALIRKKKLKDFVEKKKLKREEKLKCNKDLTMSNYPSIPKKNISLIHKSRNSRRSLFKNEIKRRDKYIKKSTEDRANAPEWRKRAERYNERIKTYIEVLKEEKLKRSVEDEYLVSDDKNKNNDKEQEDDDIEELELEMSSEHNPVSANDLLLLEDERPLKNTDVNRNILNVLQTILRNLIYKYDGKSISTKQIQDVSNDINEKEINVCKLIVDLIQPPGHLNTLPMDAFAIYSLFCGNNTGDSVKKLEIYGFNGKVILSRQLANEQKDAVFSSFFDLPEITNTAYSFNQKFNHVITFLPGLKTARVSGTLIRDTSSSNSCKVITQKNNSKVTPKQLSISAKRDINDMVTLLKTESNAIGLQLKNAVQIRKNSIITSDIKRLKNEWIKKDKNNKSFTIQEKKINDELYKKIEQEKLLKKHYNDETIVIKEHLKATKSKIYNFQKQLNTSEYGKDFTIKDGQNIGKKFEITKDNYKCFETTEDIELDEQVRYSDNLLFSGTDNGLVTMTETAKFILGVVAHIFLKHFEIEGDQGAALNFSNDDINKATLCKTFKVHSSDLQFRSGVKTSMMKLEKLKKQTDAGKVVMNIERSFMNMNIENANNIQEVDDMMDNKYKHRNNIRNFYYSNVRIKQKRRTEIQQKKCFDRTCSPERQFTSSKGNKQPIMLTGGRGYCNNSSIKDHLRCNIHLSVTTTTTVKQILMISEKKAEVFLNRTTSRPAIDDGTTREI
ncbi:hypothetical protein HPULCUR_004887 [Helicostylum pulchrum]|uniref:Uncharacterized protein n=1 Tax=Helicostylum pulchrum TaxID=562976 RepID=A0ABP9XXG9_9FUNG